MSLLVSQGIGQLIATGAVRSVISDINSRIQPASLDLCLGPRAYRIRASFLPGEGVQVAQKLGRFSLHEIDLRAGAVLETGCVYIVPLLEHLALPAHISASTNPKSSTGRVDVFTRVISDGACAFDTVNAGYTGPLYAEVSPRTFPVFVREGLCLSQIRFRDGESRCSDEELHALDATESLVLGKKAHIRDGLGLTIDLIGEENDGLVGFRARRHSAVLDMTRIGYHDISDFWEPIYQPAKSELILDPGSFYILSSRESILISQNLAAEMVPFDPLVGEFRAHYAGFFDPGFGLCAGGTGSRAVLEVRSYELPFILEHGQMIGHLVYEKLSDRPEKLYGHAMGSHYQGQRLKLSKHFKDFVP